MIAVQGHMIVIISVECPVTDIFRVCQGWNMTSKTVPGDIFNSLSSAPSSLLKLKMAASYE